MLERIVKKPLAALALAAAAIAALAVPAGAAVPNRPANDTIACGKHAASVWWDAGHIAAKNPCSQWLVLQVEYMPPDAAQWTGNVSVAPGAHFNVKLATLTQGNDPADSFVGDPALAAGAPCGLAFLVNSHGKPTSAC
jgi:hypothetical protein